MRRPTQFSILLLLLLLTGCATRAQVPPVRVMRYSADILEPTDRIEVFHTKPTDRDYVELAELSIRLDKSTEETAVLYLNDKAKELGADAIIMMGERTTGAFAMPLGNMAIAVPTKELYAIAIKYR